MTRTRPGRSVTKMRPSGANARAQGTSRPLATVSSETSACDAAVEGVEADADPLCALSLRRAPEGAHANASTRSARRLLIRSSTPRAGRLALRDAPADSSQAVPLAPAGPSLARRRSDPPGLHRRASSGAPEAARPRRQFQ